MRRLLLLSLSLALTLAALAGAPARAQQPVYYSITGVSVEQLNNAVRVKLDADGTIVPTIYLWAGELMLNYYLDIAKVREQLTGQWSPDCYPPQDRIRFHLYSALPQVGSVINVGKYPVSHIRLMVAREQTPNRYGLDVEIVLQKKMRMRDFQFTTREGWGWDAYLLDHHDPAWFTMYLSPDQRSLIVTFASDRLPDPPRHRSLSDVPDKDREVTVHAANGLLTVHARNAALSELAEAVTRESGVQFSVGEGAAARLITAQLPAITPDDLAARLADCYGLIVTRTPERIVLSDATGQVTASQAALAARVIPVRNLKAVAAAGLLPTFLLDYLRIDDQNNALLVSGPQSLADKVVADLAKIDLPPTAVSLRARVIESSSSEETARQLALQYTNAGRRFTTDSGAGQITYHALDSLPNDFETRLRALTTTGQAKVQADTSLVVLSGETGQVFSGENKYVTIIRTIWDQLPSLVPITAGVKLTATPWAGERLVTMNVIAEANSIGAVDPETGMPTVETRSVSGTFRLRPGQTVAVGGLSETREYWTRRKLPLLGDLPLLGRLFRWKTRQRTTSDLLVLLTPTVATPEVAAEASRDAEAAKARAAAASREAALRSSRLAGEAGPGADSGSPAPSSGRDTAHPPLERTWQSTPFPSAR